MTDPFDELRVIERIDAGDAIEAAIEDRPDGTRILRHDLPSGVILETIIQPDGGLTVYADDRLMLDVGPPMLLEPDEDDPYDEDDEG